MIPEQEVKILLIEDQDIIRDMMVEFLEFLGWQTLEACDSASAKQLAKTYGDSIGVVVCDVLLGRVHGPDLMKELSSFLPEIPVIFTSGYSTRDVISEDKKASTFFLAKPFTIDSLKEVLEKACSLAKTQ